MIALTADVGGTKVAVAVVTDEGQLLAKTQQATNLDGPEHVVRQISTMGGELLNGQSPDAVGVCVPAVLEHQTDRILWAPNLPRWEAADVKAILSQQFGVPAAIEYDGHAAVLGEWWAGEGRGFRSIASVIIGTGIGGGFIVDGKLWRGRDRLAGAVGWFPIEQGGSLAHWEDVASGPAIARRLIARAAHGETTTLKADGLTARDVFEAARAGDSLARAVIEEVAGYIGQGVAAVISFANPEVIVLGGSIGQQADLLLPTVEQTARRWAQPYSARDLAIRCTTLGEEAGLLGAAYSAFQAIQS